MSTTVSASKRASPQESDFATAAAPGAGAQLRVAFVGPRTLVDGLAPGTAAAHTSGSAPAPLAGAPLAGLARAPEPGSTVGAGNPPRGSGPRARPLLPARIGVAAGSDGEEALARLHDFAPEATVFIDPLSLPARLVARPIGTTLGVLTDGLPGRQGAGAVAALDRVVSFDPALTGRPIGRRTIWRAVPPPVADELFAAVKPLHGRARVMSIGRSTPHREAMLTPAKHHHDLLQIIEGVSGAALVRLLCEFDAGVWVGRAAGGGFGWQAAMHLAAGHLLLSEPLRPEHGLERGIDYIDFASPERLVALLDRVADVPETYERVRARGRMKAEQFRASRVFARLIHDLLADVAVFGPGASSHAAAPVAAGPVAAAPLATAEGPMAQAGTAPMEAA